MKQPRPFTNRGVRIVTFIDWAGPSTVEGIAEFLAASESSVRTNLLMLVSDGFVRSFESLWVSTGIFNPDDDSPQVIGGANGPHDEQMEMLGVL